MIKTVAFSLRRLTQFYHSLQCISATHFKSVTHRGALGKQGKKRSKHSPDWTPAVSDRCPGRSFADVRGRVTQSQDLWWYLWGYVSEEKEGQCLFLNWVLTFFQLYLLLLLPPFWSFSCVWNILSFGDYGWVSFGLFMWMIPSVTLGILSYILCAILLITTVFLPRCLGYETLVLIYTHELPPWYIHLCEYMH